MLAFILQKSISSRRNRAKPVGWVHLPPQGLARRALRKSRMSWGGGRRRRGHAGLWRRLWGLWLPWEATGGTEQSCDMSRFTLRSAVLPSTWSREKWMFGSPWQESRGERWCWLGRIWQQWCQRSWLKTSFNILSRSSQQDFLVEVSWAVKKRESI